MTARELRKTFSERIGLVPKEGYSLWRSDEEKRATVAEKAAIVSHINSLLEGDTDLKSVIPLDPPSDEIFEQCRDGVLLW